jgi:MerR family transcriptional regulator, light-induced transcriptional regulator
MAELAGSATEQPAADAHPGGSEVDQLVEQARSAGLAIHEASVMLGVPAPTLRAWERRYGVPAVPRSGGGHRRYSVTALNEVRLMRDEIARGRRASDAARIVLATAGQSGVARGMVDEMLAASERMDPAGVCTVLDGAYDDLGLADALDRVLLPAMRQVGEWWRTGRCDVGQEHLTTEAVRGWLSRRVAFAPEPRHGRPLLMACGPRDSHSVGLESFGVLLAYSGWPVRMLGARTPARTIATAARAVEAAGIVVVSHMSLGRRPAIEAINAAATSGRPVFYAGSAFLSPRSRTGFAGTYLGETMAGAAEIVEDRLRGGA